MKKIAVLSGDGVGPEVTTAAVSVLKALTGDIDMISADCGYECYKRTGESLPVSTQILQESYNGDRKKDEIGIEYKTHRIYNP